jgi:hypothetical protein
MNGAFCWSLPISYKEEGLFGRVALFDETAFLNGVERFSRERIFLRK